MPTQPKQASNQPTSKKRKTHSNKGAVYMNARDINVMRWIIEQDEVSMPQIQMLLARYDDKAKTKEIVLAARNALATGQSLSNPQHYYLLRKWDGKDIELKPTLSWQFAKGVVERWRRAKWVEYRNPYRDPNKPGSVYATRQGISDFGYSFDFRSRDLGSLEHLFAINHVRLWTELQMKKKGYVDNWKWISERQLRHETKNAWATYPDAEVTYGNDTVAIQVEISKKSKAAYEELRLLYAGKSVGSRSFPRAKDYNGCWYYHTQEMKSTLSDIYRDELDWYEFKLLNDLVLEDGSTLS